ncbi:MAG: hypothetical protein DMF78_24990 [Acidobacteria bacterium]|nr:MAG: hypothetical protein DMF78_24990 [Acidobacteriota bacterium]
MSALSSRPRTALALRALLPLLLHAVARDVDAAIGVVLHTTLDVPDLSWRALALVDAGDLARHVLVWLAAGAAAWAALSAGRARTEGMALHDALSAEAGLFAPLYLRPALTVLSLGSLALRPTYPYAFTLPVALGQDWGIAQDAATVAALAAARLPRLRLPAPGAVSLALMAFLAYALLTPESARHWDGHPGNEPKTLRMAVALGHGLSLDVEGVSAGMEALAPRPLPVAAREAAATLARESSRMIEALAHGPRAVGAGAIRATRITRQTIRGKEGGVYTVLAPGPSLLLAPVLRLDRALNLRRGTPGRLGLTVLVWNALAAALVAAVFLLARDGGAGRGAAATIAALAGLLPPLVFYAYQFYPEMLGALALAVALRAILLRPWTGARQAAQLGLLLACLPWLHQKFLPVWVLLAAMAVVRAVDALVSLRALLALLVPQAVSAWLVALYNFAITGSVRPDALYLAWGPAGVATARWGQGLLGLLLDARYGLLPYMPILVCALAGWLLPGASRRLRWGIAPAFIYYATVAAADNWSGAVCNLGRYVMPVVPYAAALVALVLVVALARRGVLAVLLALAAWSAILGVALWRDPHAANDCALLLAKSAIADASVYVPNLFIRSWSDGAPGLWARIAAWILLAAGLAAWVRLCARGRAGARPAAAVFGMAAAVLAAALVLERWPAARTAPRFPGALEVAPGTTAFVEDARVEGTRAWLDPGAHALLVRAREDLPALRVRLAGAEGVLRARGRAPLRIPAGGLEVDLPLERVATLEGRRGLRESLWIQRLDVDARGPVLVRLSAVK